MPIGRSSSQPSIATSCKHQMEQKPNTMLLRRVHIKTLEKWRDIRAWHINCVEVNAPRSEMAIEAATRCTFQCGCIFRNTISPSTPMVGDVSILQVVYLLPASKLFQYYSSWCRLYATASVLVAEVPGILRNKGCLLKMDIIYCVDGSKRLYNVGMLWQARGAE